MKVHTITIIAMGPPDDEEIRKGAKALFKKVTRRTSHRPRSAKLIVLDSCAAAFEVGRDTGDVEKLKQAVVTDETFSDDAPQKGGVWDELRRRTPPMRFATQNHGVYVIAHGRNAKLGGLGAMNGIEGNADRYKVGPVNLANIIWMLCGGPVDKICVLACNAAAGLPSAGGLVTQQHANKFFLVRLCMIFAGQGNADEQSRYKGGVFHPKVAGWDCLISICFEGMDATYDPDGKLGRDAWNHGRKVIEGGTLARTPGEAQKLAFQLPQNGALQALSLAGWSDAA